MLALDAAAKERARRLSENHFSQVSVGVQLFSSQLCSCEKRARIVKLFIYHFRCVKLIAAHLHGGALAYTLVELRSCTPES